MPKRTLDSFFKPKSATASTKRAKPTPNNEPFQPTIASEEHNNDPPDTHPSYPIPIPQLPSHLSVALKHGTPAKQPRVINNQPDLDLLYFQPYIARTTATELFKFLRRELPFYRVQYTIKRGNVETQVNTPRYTTVFGVDETSEFIAIPNNPESKPESESQSETEHTGKKTESPSHTTSQPTQNQNENQSQDQTTTIPTEKPSTAPISNLIPVETTTKSPIRSTKYQYIPRPIPTCLTQLKTHIESVTGARYNFCLVNYYADGNDSISFHSDDERFLGAFPDIASLSLGGEREFVMKHKPVGSVKDGQAVMTTDADMGMGKGDTASVSTTHKTTPLGPTAAQQVKLPLASGDMVVMRGPTQAHWLHSIPKRKGRGGEGVRGRINITFRRARIPAGTNNYYRYNVGSGPVWRWVEGRQEMVCVEEEEGKGGEMS